MCGESRESESLMNLTYGSIWLQVTNEQSIAELMKIKQYKIYDVFV